MPINHILDVNIRKKTQDGSRIQGNGSRVSSASTFKDNKYKRDTSNPKNILRLFNKRSATQTATNKIGKVIPPFAAAYGMAVVGSRLHDLYLSHRASISGDTMTAGNIKKGKEYVLGFGIPYVYDLIKNEFITKNIVNRQNKSNQYYRDLYYEKYEGNQYDGRVR